MPILDNNPEQRLVTLVGRTLFSQLLRYASSHAGLINLNTATMAGPATARQDFQIKRQSAFSPVALPDICCCFHLKEKGSRSERQPVGARPQWRRCGPVSTTGGIEAQPLFWILYSTGGGGVLLHRTNELKILYVRLLPPLTFHFSSMVVGTHNVRTRYFSCSTCTTNHL